MKQWFARFMEGRYGADQLSRLTTWVSLGALVLSLFLRGNAVVYSILWYVAVLLIVWNYFRMFSRKKERRYAENQKYLSIKYKVASWFNLRKDHASQLKTHRFFHCPQCGQTVRVPRGRGKIRIKCPKCGNAFIKKT